MLQADDIAMDEMVCTASVHATTSISSEGLLRIKKLALGS
jgi:hypothetical protein